MNNFIKDLPSGVDNTNLLSSTWLLDNDFKNRMFKNNRTIILLYLYCREELKKPNVHLDFELIGQFVLFSSRRNFMIELNEIYDFEQIIHTRKGLPKGCFLRTTQICLKMNVRSIGRLKYFSMRTN